jgi:hypothetical protein
MMVNPLSMSEPTRLMIGFAITLAGLAVGATQCFDDCPIF